MVHLGGPDGSAHSIDECPIHAGHRARQPVSLEDDTFVRRSGTTLSVSWVLTPVQTLDGSSSGIVITDKTGAQDGEAGAGPEATAAP
ncbi:MAG: hypothetical protein ACLP22_12275 [Solirubrobacteraceae bacterium]